MPKRNIVQIQLPAEKPDCCATCPLVGLVPKHLRQHRSKETHVCLGADVDAWAPVPPADTSRSSPASPAAAESVRYFASA